METEISRREGYGQLNVFDDLVSQKVRSFRTCILLIARNATLRNSNNLHKNYLAFQADLGKPARKAWVTSNDSVNRLLSF